MRVGGADPLVLAGAGIATVNGSGGGGHLATLSFGTADAFAGKTAQVVTDPAAFPIISSVLAVENGAGRLTRPGGGALGGALPLHGVYRLCQFASCDAPPPVANISIPLSVVGSGGSATGGLTFINFTVLGAPWTTGAATTLSPGSEALTGFAHGPASGTSNTALPSGVLQLVTPFPIWTNIRPEPTLGSATLTLHFLPEPTTALLLTIAAAALAAAGRRRHSGR